MTTNRTPRTSTTNSTTGSPGDDSATAIHRLPEGPAAWRLDEVSRQRGRAGIALARESLRLALERRALRERDEADGSTDEQHSIGAFALERVA